MSRSIFTPKFRTLDEAAQGDLSSLVARVRSLSEADEPVAAKKSSAHKNAAPSENPAEDALAIANSFREIIKRGDAMQEMVAKVASTAKAVVAAEPGIKQKRALLDLENAVTALAAQGRSTKEGGSTMYDYFSKGRDTVYSLAAALNVGTSPADRGVSSSGGKKVSFSSQVGTMSDEELVASIQKRQKDLASEVRDMLALGASAQKLLREAAKKIGLQKGELSPAEAKAMIFKTLDFRDAVSRVMYAPASVFASAGQELIRRIRTAEQYEACDWDTDTEIVEYRYL